MYCTSSDYMYSNQISTKIMFETKPKRRKMFQKNFQSWLFAWNFKQIWIPNKLSLLRLSAF